MAVHKLQIDDFISTDYSLIAIHCSIEDYRLAYFLNKELKIRLQKERNSIELKKKSDKSNFDHFCFEDEKNDVYWHLISNKSNWENKNTTNVGFFENIDSVAFLVPEFKTANYILKIENIDTLFDTESVIRTIKTIPLVSLVYTIEQDKLKSKNNLIF